MMKIESRELGLCLEDHSSVMVYRMLNQTGWSTYFSKGMSATSWIGVNKEEKGVQKTRYFEYSKKVKKYQKFANGFVIDESEPFYVYDSKEDRAYVTFSKEKRMAPVDDETLLEKENMLRNAYQNFFPELTTWTAYTEEELGLIANCIEEKLTKKKNKKGYRKSLSTNIKKS